MCLTEPQCGTDLGLVRSKAVPQEDGSYKLTGTKIFISAGDHDLTDNIIHLVLARLPDAPPGIKGLSLFLVPKFRLDADGEAGEPNGVVCGAVEHKMGIKASSTCVLNFDEASGLMLGQPHKGMRAMFTMMNTARLGVGVQGVAIAEAAYQGAAAYARERLQGRSLKGARSPQQPADSLLVHPDVRRMLLTMRAYAEGCRALGSWLGREIDIYQRSPDKARVQAAEDLVALLIPVYKAFASDAGFECANLGVQVYGGHGYIREHGMEQYVRDARITQIYEGANGIQALDLVGRKLPAHMGRYLRRFFHPVADYIEAHREDQALGEFIPPLAKAYGRLQRASAWIAQSGLRDADEAGAAASD
jgi:alkylation response protein AidB-like acyl-CoA dehydrogenase